MFVEFSSYQAPYFITAISLQIDPMQSLFQEKPNLCLKMWRELQLHSAEDKWMHCWSLRAGWMRSWISNWNCTVFDNAFRGGQIVQEVSSTIDNPSPPSHLQAILTIQALALNAPDGWILFLLRIFDWMLWPLDRCSHALLFIVELPFFSLIKIMGHWGHLVNPICGRTIFFSGACACGVLSGDI